MHCWFSAALRFTAAGLLAALFVIALAFHSRAAAAEPDLPLAVRKVVVQYCQDCHQGEDSAAGLDLRRMAAQPLAEHFHHWKKVVSRVADGQMPPADAVQPTSAEREQLLAIIRGELRRAAQAHAHDPGPVTLRRLTAGEYVYTIADLTGVDLELDLAGDAVGGEGFTNVGDVQFMQDSTLERYLSAAKKVADHAVIGAGPLNFYRAPSDAGFELSAMARIQSIYRRHGFRTAAGEGGNEFGLDRYAQAFFVSWQYHHRDRLGLQGRSLADLAQQQGVQPRFAEYLWSVLTATPRRFPTSEIVKAWNALPVPRDDSQPTIDAIRSQCQQIQQQLRQWQDRFGQNPDAKEEPRVLAADSFRVARTCELEMNINWTSGKSLQAAHLTFAVELAGRDPQFQPTVVWRNAAIQFRIPDKRVADLAPLAGFLAGEDARRLAMGRHPAGIPIGSGDFVTQGVEPLTIRIPIVPGATSARMVVTAELDVEHGQDGIVRCVISQREDTDQGKSVSALLANPEHREFSAWKAGVLEFARVLPQISQREPAPSDRDPIPAPFDNSYNNPERNAFHTSVKYHRDDRFLVENILDDNNRRRLDQAWTDLLGSFAYHDAWLNLLAEKYQFDLAGAGIAKLSDRQIDQLPADVRPYVRQLQKEYQQVQAALVHAQPGHLQDLLKFADRAWRRPLQPREQQDLASYYQSLLREADLDHRQAIRATLARILMSPNFLYRMEPPTVANEQGNRDNASAIPLTDWQVANRLSYFLWSSLPDEELRRAAEQGQLQTADQVAAQARRMLQDPKARRLAIEFFGQWFGFYQFDRYRGVDAQRFPEFTESLQAAMYAESIAFFEHIIRHDRPVREVLFADYVFVNKELAAHYGLPQKLESLEPVRMESASTAHRGGLFGLASVLTVTSAPLRTSPVKRGDWILRRVLGTPVPPPPADAGSIAADDVRGDQLTVRDRLEAHRREASCQNCHTRIDPLGFTLEQYDSIGRWRENYANGQPVDVTGTLENGDTISGPDGLKKYLGLHEDKFHQTICTKLAGYALGRGESIADAALIANMTESLAKGEGRFSSLVEHIVRSKQFRYRRWHNQAGTQKETHD